MDFFCSAYSPPRATISPASRPICETFFWREHARTWRMLAFALKPRHHDAMSAELKPTLLPLGDKALLVRFAQTLSEAANRAAIGLARALAAAPVPGVADVAPGLVSVLLRAEQGASLETIRREVMLRLGASAVEVPPARHEIAGRFDGEDLGEVAAALRLTPTA